MTIETTQGREIKGIEIKIDVLGNWSWEIQDGEDWEMLNPKNISKINEHLVKKGIKVDKNTLDMPHCQVLCG